MVTFDANFLRFSRRLMRYLVIVSANKLVWPSRCASCMGEPNTLVNITTRNITSRNAASMSWRVPYCLHCKSADDGAPPKLGWLKNLFDSFTKSEYAVQYLSLHMTSHKFEFRNKEYFDAFVSQNIGKCRSVWQA